MSAGPSVQLIYWKGTVVVEDEETQTQGITKELWKVKHLYPKGCALSYCRPSPGINPAGKELYEQFQDLLGNIKAAKDRITELGQIVDWQKRAHPERYNQTL